LQLLEDPPAPSPNEWLDLLATSTEGPVQDAIISVLLKREGQKNKARDGMVRQVFDLDIQQSSANAKDPTIALALLDKDIATWRKDSPLYPTKTLQTTGRTSLIQAAYCKSIKVIDRLLRIIENDEERSRILKTAEHTDSSMTALSLLVQKAKPEHMLTVKRFLEIDPTLVGVKAGGLEKTPLHIAVEDAAPKGIKHVRLVNALMEAHPQVLLESDKFGYPPLWYATEEAYEIRDEDENPVTKKHFAEVLDHVEQFIFDSFASVADIRAALYGRNFRKYQNYHWCQAGN
jgi:hypothetical protein